MKLIPRPTGRTRLKISVAAKRRIVAVCVTVEFATLAVMAAEVRLFHRHGSLIAVAFLLLGIVCGLNYLRSTGGRR